jgi:type II secretory pathway pseudopilin PulG
MLFFGLVFGAIVAAIASSKGRNPVGWFFFGFFFGCLAIILVLVLPNLKEQQAKEQRLEEENRRIREQVRQEQMRLEAFRQQTNSRLDRHDQVLQIDTAPRMESPLGLGGVAGTPPALPNGAQDDQRPIWFYVKGDNRCGPVSLGALRALLAGGEVNADSLFWRSGMSEWQPGRNVPEIRALFR